MILETTKIGIAMKIIEEKIGKCMVKRRKNKDREMEEEYNKLLLEREEIYKGNYDVINKIINETGGKEKND